MKKNVCRNLLFLGVFLSPSLAWSQDDDFPFEDFPGFEDQDVALPADAVSENGNDDQQLPVEEPVAQFEEEESFEDLAADPVTPAQNNVMSMGVQSDSRSEPEVLDAVDVSPVRPSQSIPEELTVTAPSSPPSPLLSQPTNVPDFEGRPESLFSSQEDFPEDVEALRRRLEDAESAYGRERLREQGLGEPGEGLAPSEQFSRVPLRPPMSDANWLRWAGPMATKEYRVRRGDSLWAVSERLFGNPYLWPKIWHLNARITNPHIIEQGMTLSFNPGNPGSAPELAFRPSADDMKARAIHPLTSLDKKKTLLEVIDETLRRQIQSEHPPFQDFLLDRKPEVLAEVPNLVDRSGKVFFTEGDIFRTNLGDGNFPIARVLPVTEKFFTAYRVKWLGMVSVRNKRAEVTKAFMEIMPGDLIVQRRFQLSPLAIHTDTIGPELRKNTALIKLQEGAQFMGGTHQMMGIRFPAIGVGPRPGAMLEIQVGHNKKTQALLVDRDQRVGTLWLMDGEQEVITSDSIF